MITVRYIKANQSINQSRCTTKLLVSGEGSEAQGDALVSSGRLRSLERKRRRGNRGILEKSRVSNSLATYDAFNYVSTESHVTRDVEMYCNRVRPGLARYPSLQEGCRQIVSNTESYVSRFRSAFIGAKFNIM